MADTVSKRRRSEIMSRIHGGLRDNKLERTVHNWLKGTHIPHRMYPRAEGDPDIVLKNNGVQMYIFLDGCFWHCCPKHYRRPKTNKKFWVPHIEGSNRRREDMRKTLSYRWIRIWEHEVRDGSFKRKILSKLNFG